MDTAPIICPPIDEVDLHIAFYRSHTVFSNPVGIQRRVTRIVGDYRTSDEVWFVETKAGVEYHGSMLIRNFVRWVNGEGRYRC